MKSGLLDLVLFQICLHLVSSASRPDEPCPALSYHEPHQILEITKSSCFIAAPSPTSAQLLQDFETLSAIFKDDLEVTFGLVGDVELFRWPSGEKLVWKKNASPQFLLKKDIAVFPKIKVDRTCLSTNLLSSTNYPTADYYVGPRSLPLLIEYVNSVCGTFRTAQGTLNVMGLHKKYILENLFHVSEVTNVSIGQLYNMHDRFPNLTSHDIIGRRAKKKYTLSDRQKSCKYEQTPSSKDTCDLKSAKNQENHKIHQCEEISMPAKADFFHKYLKRSKPVIIKNATSQWPALQKWTNDFLRREYGERQVHVKLAPGGDYEGVEKAEIWDDFEKFKIPRAVHEQLEFPDLVVVRPAVLELKFEKFLDMIEEFVSEKGEKGTAYLEYSSIPQYMPELEEDMKPFSFMHDALKRKHLNIWLSDGHTLGRLHFDPFDNLLCQISGQKQVTLFDPHGNEKLYEAHIPEALLGYDKNTKTFRRKSLQDSTSMVMSPVDYKNPDLQRFSRFAEAIPLNCTISEGDVLFMPAFWWHEVQSSPSITQNRNLAVNFWYEPFLTKEFPCAECRLDVNSAYHHLLQ